MQERDNIKGIINQADIYAYQQHDPAKALEHYEKFVAFNPRSGSLINNMIGMYYQTGRQAMSDHHQYLAPFMQVSTMMSKCMAMTWWMLLLARVVVPCLLLPRSTIDSAHARIMAHGVRTPWHT
jgi:hypothetical protein